MRTKLKENDPIFDGFAHRGFQEEIDGWRNDQPDAMDYQAVNNARDVLAMFEEIQVLRKQVWRLRQAERMLGKTVYGESYEGMEP